MRPWMAVAGLVALVRQARLGVVVAAWKRLPFFRRFPVWLCDRMGWVGVGHQKKNHMMTKTKAGTPSSQAMKNFPMVDLLKSQK